MELIATSFVCSAYRYLKERIEDIDLARDRKARQRKQALCRECLDQPLLLFSEFEIRFETREQEKQKEARKFWMEQGKVTSTELRSAQEWFSLAFSPWYCGERVGDRERARFWYAIACLRDDDMGVFENLLFEDAKRLVVRQDIGVFPALLAEWYIMCHYDTQSPYLMALRFQERFLAICASGPARFGETPIDELCQAVAAYVNGSFIECSGGKEHRTSVAAHVLARNG